MSNFDTAILTILKQEGGYVNDPDDPGGETNFGISKRTYPNFNIKLLTKDQAIDIYRKDWWDKYQYSRIQDQELATEVFSFAVNAGAIRAHKFLQVAIIAITRHNLVIDGNIGPITIKEINDADASTLLKAFRAAAITYYLDLTISKPSQIEYLKGWINRIIE